MLKNFSEEKFDIIIQAGQSNSEGCGRGTATTPFVQSPDIWYLDNDFTISMAHEIVVENEIVNNFSLAFATEYIKSGRLENGRKLLIIRAAIGGTGFVDKRWGLSDDLFLTMMEMIKTALGLNPENRLVAFLWHQGESDAIGISENTIAIEDAFLLHYNNLSTLLNTVRKEFNVAALPFIAGDFVNDWKSINLKFCEPIIDGIKKVCEDAGNSKFVETSELQSNNQRIGNGDIIHFCREAQNLLGVKYYNAYCEIVG